VFTFRARLQRRSSMILPSVGSRTMTATWGWIGSTLLIGRRNRVVGFQDLVPLRGERVLVRAIDSVTIRKSLFEMKLRPIIFFDGLLRKVLSSKGGGVQQETGELTSLDRSLNTSRFRCLET